MSVLLVESSLARETKPCPPPAPLPAVDSVRVCRPIRTGIAFLVSDTAAILSSLATASIIRDHIIGNSHAPVAPVVIPALLITLLLLAVAGLYPGVCINPVEELRRLCLSVTAAFLALWSATLFFHDLTQSRLIYGLAFVLALGLTPLLRAATRRSFSRKSWWGSQVAILGYGEVGKLVMRTLVSDPAIGLRPIAVFDDDPSNYTGLDPKISRGPLSRCLQVTREHRISYGILCTPDLGRSELLSLIDSYGRSFSHLMVIPDLLGMTSLGVIAREFSGIVGLEIKLRLLRPAARFAKRTIDLMLAFAVLPFVVSIVALFAGLVKLEDGGPMFYGDRRVGKNGKLFTVWKLRSMKTNGDALLHQHLAANPQDAARWALTQKLPHDPRITRIGRILRKTSIDELPQWWNVFRGEMSFVGPRPILPSQVEIYGPSFHMYTQVRPGITGLWQVSGRNELTFLDRARLDKYVIQNWSVWLDLYILIRTAGVVLSGRGAY